MGLLFSLILSYAGVLEAMECLRHIMAGLVPETEPDFTELVEHYKLLLQKSTNVSNNTSSNWVNGGQGYLCLDEDEEGRLKSAAVKYYDGSQPDSTAILFSTKISSFGQDSMDRNSGEVSNDEMKSERYSLNTTKTLIPNYSESFSVGQRNKSPTPSYANVSDPSPYSGDFFARKEEEIEQCQPRVEVGQGYIKGDCESRSNKQQWNDEADKTQLQTKSEEEIKISAEQTTEDKSDSEDKPNGKEKLTWHYRPLSPVPQTLPEIHFQPYDNIKEDSPYTDEFLRSLDGIKFHPLQRNDPSGRRRSYKKRHSSSSTSSRDSRASREEELKMFTSLEEAEFERVNKDEDPGSNTNLAARSYSRSRSRENSKDRRNETWSMEGSVDSPSLDEETRDTDNKPRLKDLPKLDSFEEEKVEEATNEVTNQEGEDNIDDFWGNSGD